MKATKGSSDLPMLIQSMQEPEPVKYYKQITQITIHHFYITDEIGEVEKYLDMIHTLKTCDEQDTVFIYLNTPGGNLNTAIHIINAIRQSIGSVITCIESEVCSAGTMIFLAGDKHIINDNCTFMIHNYSHGVIGMGHEVLSKVKYTEKYFKKFAKDIYGGFLTDDELEIVINGGDIWMESDDVRSRLHATTLKEEIVNVPVKIANVVDTSEAEEIVSVEVEVTPALTPKKATKKK